MKKFFTSAWTFIKHIVCLHIVFLAGCTQLQAPTDSVVNQHQLKKLVVTGTQFKHVVYEKKHDSDKRKSEGKKTLRVYLGGDGTPWLNNQPAADPTPRNPLTLRLMVQDSSSAIFVGRPCYDGLSTSDNCFPLLWTDARYSQVVVDSLAAVIDKYFHQHDYESIILFGYSGGGVLATLLADQIGHTDVLVTIAANLDTSAWVRHHQYEPMEGSLNPAITSVVSKKVMHLHLSGTLDTVVPPQTTKNFFIVNGGSIRWQYSDFDHVCCWVEQWPQILGKIDREIKNRPTVQHDQIIAH